MASLTGGLLLASTASSIMGQQQAGSQAKKISKIQAGQLEENANLLDYSANATEATGINAASTEKRKAKLIESRILALNAADGGSSTDKNIAELLANTSAEGEYNALNAIYEGSSRATQIRNEAISNRNQAKITRYTGKETKKAANIESMNTLVRASSKGYGFYNKYGNANFDTPEEGYG